MNLKDVKCKGSALRKKQRVGRGTASGQGGTAGRGHNGQGSRSGSGGKFGFEGGQMPLARRLPKRGFTNALFRTTYAIVNVSDLATAFPEGGDVDLAAVKSRNMVKKKATTLKILGKGDIRVPVKVKADRISETARQKIEAAGGSVELSS